MTTSRQGAPRQRWSRRASERGAVAVEFGLLMPVLAAMLFGIISYGLWFSDSLSVRDGVREAARVAAVKNWTAEPSCGTGLANAACVARHRIHALTGAASVKVFAPQGWVKGKPVVVCAVIKTDAIPSLVPMPNDGVIQYATRMSIENVAVGGETQAAFADTLPTGVTSWGSSCTP